MGFAVVGVVADGFLVALDSVGDLTFLQERVAGICGDLGSLVIHVGAFQFRAFFAFSGSFGGVALLREHSGQSEVRVWLVGHLANRFAEGVGGFGKLVHFAVEAAQRGPAVGVIGVQLHGQGEFAGGVVVAAVLHKKNAESVVRFVGGGI